MPSSLTTYWRVIVVYIWHMSSMAKRYNRKVKKQQYALTIQGAKTNILNADVSCCVLPAHPQHKTEIVKTRDNTGKRTMTPETGTRLILFLVLLILHLFASIVTCFVPTSFEIVPYRCLLIHAWRSGCSRRTLACGKRSFSFSVFPCFSLFLSLFLGNG